MIKTLLVLLCLQSLIFSSSAYYHNSGKKVILEKQTKISRALKNKECYVYQGTNVQTCIQNEIIIKTSPKNIKEISKKYSLKIKRELFKNVFLVSVKNYKKTIQIANNIQENEDVEYAHPNFENKKYFRTSLTEPIKVPDPLVKDCWYLKNTGQKPNYKIGADIKIEEAWPLGTRREVRIGIIDDGIEITHPDIVYRDGYTIGEKNARNPSHKPSNKKHHGTKVAGLISAKKNNVGSIGAAFDTDLYVVNIDGSSKVSDIVDAFEWLRSKQVFAINNSWGSYNVPEPVKDIVIDLMTNARGGKGISIIFSVGNDGLNMDELDHMDESQIPGVIAVGASTPYDNRYVKSNYGSTLTLLAPGVDMLVPRKISKTQLYVTETGTSLAAPLVTATIGIMVSSVPNLPVATIKKIFEQSADKIATNEYPYPNGRNPYYGYGRLNARDAVRAALAWSDVASMKIKPKDFSLPINKGWNLLSLPTKSVILQKDYEKYFGVGSKVITLRHNNYNHYSKMLFPSDGFFVYAKSATTAVFNGYDYNSSFTKTPIDIGWNLLGAGRDTNITSIRTAISNTDYLHLFRNGKFTTESNESKQIKRGEGFFIYKLQ